MARYGGEEFAVILPSTDPEGGLRAGERLREAMKSLNCGHLMILMQIGSMPPELVRKSTTLFATEVMPYMRDLWTDFEDKWSPKRMPQDDIAMPAAVHFQKTEVNGKARAAAPGAAEVRGAK